MNTKHLANRFDTDGEFHPMEFCSNKPSFEQVVCEALCGVVGLIALFSFIILVFTA